MCCPSQHMAGGLANAECCRHHALTSAATWYAPTVKQSRGLCLAVKAWLHAQLDSTSVCVLRCLQVPPLQLHLQPLPLVMGTMVALALLLHPLQLLVVVALGAPPPLLLPPQHLVSGQHALVPWCGLCPVCARDDKCKVLPCCCRDVASNPDRPDGVLLCRWFRCCLCCGGLWWWLLGLLAGLFRRRLCRCCGWPASEACVLRWMALTLL
jgi:hypothetical protein